MPLKLASYGLTDVGRKRSHNEDSYLINDDLSLFIVADGMGGHSGGEFASRMSVETILEVVKNITSDPEATVISGVNTADADFGDRLRYAIETASGKIYDQSLYDQSLKGMGTTTVAALFHENQLYVANVGDSRAYLFHANKMSQITTDHSLVTEQVKAGLLNENDAKKHKLKNIITRSVGYQEQVEIDLKKFDLHLGDKLLLCSDGLSNMVNDQEIERIVVNHPIKGACKKLVDSANEHGGEDNVTVVLVEVLDIA